MIFGLVYYRELGNERCLLDFGCCLVFFMFYYKNIFFVGGIFFKLLYLVCFLEKDVFIYCIIVYDVWCFVWIWFCIFVIF